MYSTLLGWWLAQQETAPAPAQLADSGPFTGLKKAIQWLSTRVSRTKGQFLALKQRGKEAGFTVARVFRTATIEKIKSSLADSLGKGETLETWRDESLRHIAGTSGIGNSHAETIYRNTFQSARQSAMREEWRRPAFEDWIVAYEYLTMDDDRVREEHAILHGTILAADDPRVDQWWPPNGYNCRCMFLPIDRLEAQARGFEITKDVPDFKPDDGWEGPPDGV